MATGFAPLAAPTARTASGAPTRRAISRYETVVPTGIVLSASQTRRWNGVPPVSTGTPSSASSRRRK